MNLLCLDWQGEATKFVFCEDLGIASPFYPILKHFAMLAKKYRSDVFERKWKKHKINLEEQMKSQDKQLVTQQDFLEQVWKKTLIDCHTLLASCVKGSAVVAEVVNESGFQNLEKIEIKRNLLALQKGLMECFPVNVPKGEIWADNICRQIEYYQLACHGSEAACHGSEAACHLVKLQACLKRKGKHKLIADFAAKVCFHVVVTLPISYFNKCIFTEEKPFMLQAQ